MGAPFGSSTVVESCRGLGVRIAGRGLAAPPPQGRWTRRALAAIRGGTWERPMGRLADRLAVSGQVHRPPAQRAATWSAYCVPLVVYPDQTMLPGEHQRRCHRDGLWAAMGAWWRAWDQRCYQNCNANALFACSLHHDEFGEHLLITNVS